MNCKYIRHRTVEDSKKVNMNYQLKLLVTLLSLSILLACHNSSANKVSLKNSSISDKMDSIINEYYQNKQFSGAVLVADKGNILLNNEYGFQNIDSSDPITSETVFEIASLSKQFTAVLVLMMKEEDKLNIDDKVIQYLPSFPYKNITIRHLLTHTSGLSEKKFYMWAGQNMDPSKTYTNQFVLSYLEQEKPSLAFEPGTKWEYSNVGYFILPLILEQITGEHFIQLLSERIFEPLDMTNTGIFSQDYKGNNMDNYAFGKIFNPKDSVFVSSFGMAWSDSIYGSVGILSNTTDLFKWDRALYSNSLTNQETLSEAFNQYILADGSPSGYGFGWFVKDDSTINDVNWGKRVDHYGLWPGYESSIVRYIDKDKTIIILSNQAPSAKDLIVEKISQILFE